MPHMNMKYLRSFLAFVEERSTAKAAHRLGIARHNIAPHVAAVEKTVGQKLLETRYPRNHGETGRTQLTDAGRVFFSRALRAMRAHDDMLDMQTVMSDPRGESMAVAGGLLELALDALRNNLSDVDRDTLNAILVNSGLETGGSPVGRLHRGETPPA